MAQALIICAKNVRKIMIKKLDMNCEFCEKVYEIKKADYLVNGTYLCSGCLDEFRDCIFEND